MDEYYTQKTVKQSAAFKSLPDVVHGMLALAEIEVEFSPERWNRGARKRAFWKLRKLVRIRTHHMRSIEDTIKHGAGPDEWRFVITSMLDKADETKQVQHSDNHA